MASKRARQMLQLANGRSERRLQNPPQPVDRTTIGCAKNDTQDLPSKAAGTAAPALPQPVAENSLQPAPRNVIGCVKKDTQLGFKAKVERWMGKQSRVRKQLFGPSPHKKTVKKTVDTVDGHGNQLTSPVKRTGSSHEISPRNTPGKKKKKNLHTDPLKSPLQSPSADARQRSPVAQIQSVTTSSPLSMSSPKDLAGKEKQSVTVTPFKSPARSCRKRSSNNSEEKKNKFCTEGDTLISDPQVVPLRSLSSSIPSGVLVSPLKPIAPKRTKASTWTISPLPNPSTDSTKLSDKEDGDLHATNDSVDVSQCNIKVLGLLTSTGEHFTSNVLAKDGGDNDTTEYEGFDEFLDVLPDCETTPTGAQVIYQELVESTSVHLSPVNIARQRSLAGSRADHGSTENEGEDRDRNIQSPSITGHLSQRNRDRTFSDAADHDLNENDEVTDPTYQTPEPQPRKRTRTPGTGSSGSPVRKRARNPAMWKSNIRKVAKNSGQEYVTTRGKQMPAKQMRPACSCKFDCLHRVSEDKRETVFRTFWGLSDHDRQWEYIRAHSVSKPTQSVKGKRACHRTFYLEKERVCKKMFMTTLSIWDSWIESAYNHVNSSKGNTSTPDKRGRHQNHPVQLTPEKVKTVQDHVAQYPRVPSHYCRQRTKREYLQHGMTLKKMARQYAHWAKSENLPQSAIANMRQYEDIVNSHFNLGFFKPKKDQCKLCCLMRSKDNTPEIRQMYKQQWVAHIKNKDLLKKIKDKDKAAAVKDRSIALCSFDLQKQLSCPKSEASPFFYSSKLNIYNFTVFHSIKRLGFCYLWHEGMAKKGSDEVSSSLFHFITELVGEGYKEFIFYSDNCAGQNKNRFIFSMYEMAAVKYSIKITHKFLEPGHTMMEVDSIHARIEKSTAGKEIFDFKEWVNAIENAKEQLPKYKVIPFKKNFVKTFKPLVSMQNWETDLKGKNITWKKVKEVSINGSEGNLVRIKYELEGDIVTMSPNKPGRPVNLKTYSPPAAYDSSLPLSTNTIRDLKKLCDSLAIPISKHPFYNAVLAGCDPTDDDAATNPEYETDEELCMGDTLEEETDKQDNRDDNGEKFGSDDEDLIL